MIRSGLLSGLLPSSIATVYNLVVCNLDNNVLTGTLDDFAFQTIANREDLHSRLRYLDLANNSFVGAHRLLAHRLLLSCSWSEHGCSFLANSSFAAAHHYMA